MRNIKEDILHKNNCGRDNNTRILKVVLNDCIMDFEDIENKYPSSNFFDVTHTCENRLCQNTQGRYRKLSCKRIKATPTSALMIDRLKSDFRYPGDFATRVRMRRNWRPELLIRYLRDNRRNEDCIAVQRGKTRSRSFVPEAPKIYSIGLRSDTRNSCHEMNDLSSSCAVIKNMKKHFNIILRAMIVCKYWVAPTSSSSATVSAEECKNHGIMADDFVRSADVYKLDRTRKNNRSSRDDLLYKRAKERNSNEGDILPGDRAAGDRSFVSDVDDTRDYARENNESRVVSKRDVQIQTSSRSSWRLRKTKTKRKSKPTNEKSIPLREHGDEPIRQTSTKTPREKTVAEFQVGCRSSNRTRDREKSRLSVRVLENKRAEYINKFTAVNRQIEEITAALRETCYSDRSWRNLENGERYLSSVRDDAKMNDARRESNDDNVEDNFATVARRTSKGKNDFANDERIIGKSKNDRRENVPKISRTCNINNEIPVLDKRCSKDATVSSMNPERDLNEKDASMRDSAPSFRSIKESSVRFSGKETHRDENKRSKRRFVKRLSFNSHLTKDENDIQKLSIEDKLFDKVCLRNNFVPPTKIDNERARASMENLADSERTKRKKRNKGKVGEMEDILEDIKRRIDRDFEDPSLKSGNDTEDFFTFLRRKNNDFENDRQLYRTEDTSAMTIERSNSAPSIVLESSNPDSPEIRIFNSTSVGAMSEYSNKNSTLSKYYSCTQSLISLREDRSTPVCDSYSNLSSSTNYYDLNLDRSCSSPNNNCSNFDPARSNSGYIAQLRDAVTRRTNLNKFPIEASNEANGASELSAEREVGNKVRDLENNPLEGGNEEEERNRSRVHLEKQYAVNSALETSKSSRYIGSIDSGVFVSSSLIDLCPRKDSPDSEKSKLRRKQRRSRTHGESSTLAFDFNSDSSYTSDTLDRRIDDVVRDLTKNLVLCERRARMKLKKMQKEKVFRAKDALNYPRVLPSSSRTRESNGDVCNDDCDNLFNSSGSFSEDERIVSISTPSLLSLSDSEIENSAAL